VLLLQSSAFVKNFITMMRNVMRANSIENALEY
jgi:hypothetical protein